ncbi:MAG: hypothetical protein WA705_05050 [Candidatus Ozemobacteraceae bacterium]
MNCEEFKKYLKIDPGCKNLDSSTISIEKHLEEHLENCPSCMAFIDEVIVNVPEKLVSPQWDTPTRPVPSMELYEHALHTGVSPEKLFSSPVLSGHKRHYGATPPVLYTDHILCEHEAETKGGSWFFSLLRNIGMGFDKFSPRFKMVSCTLVFGIVIAASFLPAPFSHSPSSHSIIRIASEAVQPLIVPDSFLISEEYPDFTFLSNEVSNVQISFFDTEKKSVTETDLTASQNWSFMDERSSSYTFIDEEENS